MVVHRATLLALSCRYLSFSSGSREPAPRRLVDSDVTDTSGGGGGWAPQPRPLLDRHFLWRRIS